LLPLKASTVFEGTFRIANISLLFCI